MENNNDGTNEWKSNSELQEKLKDSPYYVSRGLDKEIVDEFLSQGGFDNPDLEIPITAELPRAFVTNKFDFDGDSYCIKKAVEDPWHTIDDCIHGDEVVASTKNGVNHVAPISVVEKDDVKYVVQKTIIGQPLRNTEKTTKRRIIDEITKMGIFCPDLAESVIVEENGNWVFVDTGKVISGEEHEDLIREHLKKDTNTEDTLFDEYKDRS